MTIETSVFATLSGLASGGAWANAAPDQPTTPYLVFARVSGVPENTLAGDRPGLVKVRMQIDCYDLTYEGVKALAESVKTAMLAAVFRNYLDTDQDLYEFDVKRHRVTLDYFCWQ